MQDKFTLIQRNLKSMRTKDFQKAHGNSYNFKPMHGFQNYFAQEQTHLSEQAIR